MSGDPLPVNDTPKGKPPVAQVAVLTLALVVIGGIYLASHIPNVAPLGPAVGLLAAAVVLLLGNFVLLSRLRDFAWHSFFRVLRWALVTYVVIAGMLEYVFVLDHTRGTMLVVLTSMLIVFAVDIPTLFAFTVALYQDPKQDRLSREPLAETVK